MRRALPFYSPTPIWIGLALICGVGVALLPLPLAILLLGGLGFVFICYLEPTLALIAMLCLAPMKTLIETEANLHLPLDIGQWTLAFFIACWILHYVTLEKCNIRLIINPILAGLGLFILAASFSLWTAYSATQVIRECLKWIQMGVLVMLVGQMPHRWHWIALGVAISAALQAIIGIWEFRGGSGAAHLWILDYRFFRAFGTFGQPNPFGGFMGLIGPLAFGLGLGYLAQWYYEPKKELPFMAILYIGFTGLIVLGLLTSWSRGAWLGFMGAVGLVLWSFPRQRWMGNIALVGGGGLVVGLWVMGLLPASLTERLTSFTQDLTSIEDVRGVVISNDNYAVVERLAHWQAAIHMAESSPWLGVGFGNYEQAYPDFDLINWSIPLGHAHNYYLNLWAETGIIGLLSYVLLWGIVLLLTLQTISSPVPTWPERGLAAGLLGTWTHLGIHSLLDNLYVNNLFLHIGVLMGLLAALHQIRTAHRDGIIHHQSY